MKNLVSWITLILAIVLFAVFRHFFMYQTGDDAFIYYRYVERAMAGEWWSWTSQLGPVEGYSSPLWYLLLIMAGKIGMQIQSAAQLLGTLFATLALIGTWRLARILGASSFLAGVAGVFLSVNLGFQYWASAGLETSLYVALMVWAAMGIIGERFWWMPVALIGVSRPEGMFLLPAILVAMKIVKRNAFSSLHLLLCLVPMLVWILARLVVYGDIFPNTFYAKATGSLVEQLYMGSLYSMPVLFPLLLLWFVWWKKRDQSLMIVLGLASMLTGIVLLGGGDWMFHFRLLLPLYPLLLAAIFSQIGSSSFRVKVLVIAAIIPFLLLVVPARYWLPALQGQELDVLEYQEGNMTHMSVRLAAVIEERYPPHTLVAVNHAGALPWALPDFDFIDMAGLNDAHIARQKGRLHHKFDVDYVLANKPELIVLNTRVKPGTDGVWYHKGYWSGEDALVESPAFIRDYVPTDLIAGWHWSVPYPYSLLVKNADSSWIVVFRRKHE